ncbi:MAG: hypothetical protein WBO46_04415 [Caldilineaceae bacterium]
MSRHPSPYFAFIFALCALWAGVHSGRLALPAVHAAEVGTTPVALFLPVLAGSAATPTATITPTPTRQQTATVTATPTPTATATPTAPVVHPLRAFFVNTEWKTASGDVEIDAKGGMHIAYGFYEAADGSKPVGAVYLAGPPPQSDCLAGKGWGGISTDQAVRDVQLALTAAGQPRLLVHAWAGGSQGGGEYHYYECDANCTDPAQWGGALVVKDNPSGGLAVYDDDMPQRSFALDHLGRPRFVYFDSDYTVEPDHYGTFYVQCDADCTVAANWQETLITKALEPPYQYDYEIVKYPALAFTSDGRPRIATAEFYSFAQEEPALGYFECDSGCNSRDNWRNALLFPRGQGLGPSVDIALDSQDRPRIAFYPKQMADGSGEQLYYVWCNGDCAQAGNWQRFSLETGKNNGQEPDLRFDSQGRPRIAYADESTGGVGLLRCDVNCESGVAAWQKKNVETAAQLYAAWDVPFGITCDAGLWNGLTPALALDPAGNPVLAYDATYHARCWWDDPNDNQPPYWRYMLVMRTVRVNFPE